MSRTIDYLIRQGIDCIKIAKPKHRFDGTLFLPLNLDDRDFLKRICQAGWIETSDYMKIETEGMSGREIMDLNAKLSLEENKRYDVIKISYIPPPVSKETLKRADVSYMVNKI